MEFAFLTGSLITWQALISLAQPIRVPSLPEDLPKTAVLIEKDRSQTDTRYVPIPSVALPSHFPFPSNVIVDSNLSMHVSVEDVAYDPRESGVLITYSGVAFVVTVNHVVSPDGDVFFRITQKGESEPRHESHASMFRELGFDWIRDTNADLAVSQ